LSDETCDYEAGSERSLLNNGVINASALLATIDKGQAFNNPKKFVVWIPTLKQHESGNISKISSITKRENRYLRKQILHGTIAPVRHAAKNTYPLSLWAPSFASLNRLIKWPSSWFIALPG
jgi:hypothetical protein